MGEKMKALKMTLVLLIVFGMPYLYSLYAGMDELQQNASEKSIQSIEKAIEKAAVLCYAIEGSYPPDVKYLSEHYGLIMDEENYFYYYEVSGSNLFPKIAVFKR